MVGVGFFWILYNIVIVELVIKVRLLLMLSVMVVILLLMSII